MSGAKRIERRFAALKAQGRGGLVVYVTAIDPDFDTSLALVKGLPEAGADVIELGIPFTDPMADGPAIQAAGLRALAAGASLKRVLALVTAFREHDSDTPIILMGYYNPIHAFGVPAFLKAAQAAGVDGLIVVDLPPEEDAELCIPATEAGLAFIRLVAPTTQGPRLNTVLARASGFVYYVSIAGVTGTASADVAAVAENVRQLRAHTDLPLAVGFGIKTPAQVAEMAAIADAAVVGSAVVSRLAANLDERGAAKPGLLDDVLGFVGELASGLKPKQGARRP